MSDDLTQFMMKIKFNKLKNEEIKSQKRKSFHQLENVAPIFRVLYRVGVGRIFMQNVNRDIG